MADSIYLYQFRRSLISTDYREQIIKDTLEMYQAGEDITDSPLAVWGRMCLDRGDPWWYGCEGTMGSEREDCIQARQQAVIDLYHSIKKDGYTGSPISVFFDDSGQVRLYDGFHRISIMAMLGLDPVLNVRIATFDPTPELRGHGDRGSGNRDFPLIEKLNEINSGPNSYHPIDDPRMADIHIWRQDSQARLDLILPHLIGNTVMDGGCSEGFFSRQLAKRGYSVTALDYDPRRIAITRYISIIKNLSLEYIVGNWEQEILGRYWDNVLLMSVIHHHLLNLGPDRVAEFLAKLRGTCERLVVESPLTSRDLAWIDKPGAFKFTVEGLGEYLEGATGMKLIKVFRIPGDLPPRDIEVPVLWARRPIFILEAQG